MLSALEARGIAAAEAATDRARERVAAALRIAFPGVEVLVQERDIYLSGRLDIDDARLRWLGRQLL
ncbi:hypothetical protein [Sphingomonas sp. HMP6]|uniref:hypothetical protein n=1 Tax=Sphingomonas sp. HMP6 TaxID=1517551 RepID=UPI001596A256|nr:hypothetical protein [Sphingomonas sp. HMP6]BCA59601.1 hypothetical protein HMP06_2370 [Sphingomonas sp. HMP6]